MTDLKSFKVMLGDSIKDPKEAEKLAQLAKDLEALFDHDKTELIKQNAALAADNERLTEELQKQKEMTIACADELIQAASELSGIKKQDPVFKIVHGPLGSDGQPTHCSFEDLTDADPVNFINGTKLYAKPVHQHSFTLSGIGTFYADSEVCITYLERLHGVGGKANLKAVDEEHF